VRVPSGINYVWRLVATGLAFGGLGVGGLVLALTIIPLVSFTALDPQLRARRAQAVVRLSFRVYVWALCAFGVVRLEVLGGRRLADCRGKLIIANHPTLLDVVLIMSLVPNLLCVVKHQLWRNPLLGPLVRVAGYIRNDQEPESFIENCRAALAAGNNLLMFPEGTRSVPGRRLRFHRGFAHIATLTGADVQPITITCCPITLVKGQAWYVIPDRPPAFRVEIDENLQTKEFLGAAPRSIGARRLLSHVESFYVGKLQHG
jgi:1-acyl-sn-glycerol-3-phosphate acyltransferase